LDNAKDNKDSISHWLSVATSTAGAIISGIVSANDPTLKGIITGSTLGAVITSGLENIGQEMRNRFLSKKETSRIGSSFYFLLEKFDENIKNGKNVRKDNFFDNVGGEYNRNEEILEGVVIAAQRSYEEKKVRYISYFYANILFETRWDAYHANHFLRLAEKMSYRQFCLLTIYYHGSQFGLNQGNYSPSSRVIGYDTISELISLKDNALLGLTLPLKNGDGKVFMFPPENAFLTEYGSVFCQLFGLAQIPIEDVLEVAEYLVTPKKIVEIRKEKLNKLS
jgi:hypothetical protein